MEELEATPPDKKEETKRQSKGINVELLEHRIDELVKDTEEIKKDIKDIRSKIGDVREDIREIKTEIKHIASKSWVLAGALIAAGVTAGIIVSILKLWPPTPSVDQELMNIVLELAKKD